MQRISRDDLLIKYADMFTDLYQEQGLSVAKIAPILGISTWHAYQLKRYLGLHQERWQRVGMPATFSDDTIKILYGTLLGDGSLVRPGNNKYRSLSIAHSSKQVALLAHKRKVLSELKPSDITSAYDKWGTLRFVTSPHPEFDSIYQDMYPNGVKTITRKVLDRLSSKSIAIWFMDDGTLLSDKSGFGIASCGFTDQCHNIIKSYFKDVWNIRVLIKKYRYNRIYIFSDSALKFKQIIEPHIIPEMLYKLSLKDGVGTQGHQS